MKNFRAHLYNLNHAAAGVTLQTKAYPMHPLNFSHAVRCLDRGRKAGTGVFRLTGTDRLGWSAEFIGSFQQQALGFYNSQCIKFYIDFTSYLTFLIVYTALGFRFSYEYSVLEGFVHL
jgi:hypothetical protein